VRFSFASGHFRLVLLLSLLCTSTSRLQGQVDPQWVTSRMSVWYAQAARTAPGEWGIAIADQGGRMLWSLNPDQVLMPASAVKLFTTGYARSVLGGTARRATRVVGAGVVDKTKGEWLGTWALELNGDPTLERAEGRPTPSTPRSGLDGTSVSCSRRWLGRSRFTRTWCG
jgi:D-alanyl-D-alanine carboxypeptidase